MGTEILTIAIWYLVVSLVGWSTFPLAYAMFRHVPDRGFALAKTQGIFLLAYVVWLAVSLHLTTYTRGAIIGCVGLLWLVNAALCVKHRAELITWLRTHVRLILLIEGLFVGFFIAALIIRMYNPELTGAEKEADFTFLNAILHSPTFPPKDTWFVGEPINYYYFGYLIWATVVKLTGIAAPVGFNLALATTVALAATGSFSLVYALTQRLRYSLLAPLLLLVFGNLDGLVQLVQRRGNPFPFNWWQSSRVIPDTINEFPYFSFLLGDLHAHFMTIPFGIWVLGLLSRLTDVVRALAFADQRRARWETVAFVLLSGLALGGIAVINTWDYPTFLILMAGCLAGMIVCRKVTDQTETFWSLGVLAGSVWIALFALSRLLFWPFYLHFTPQLTLSSLRLVAANQRTGFNYFLVIYGLFLWILVFFLGSRFRQFFTLPKGEARLPRMVLWCGMGLGVVILYLAAGTWVFPVACLISGLFAYLFIQTSRTSVLAAFPYLLICLAFAIVAGCEIVYIKDFYGHPLERQNTIFKFYYQAWVLLAMGVPCTWSLTEQHAWPVSVRPLKRLWTAVTIVLCGVSCIYLIFGTYERVYHFRCDWGCPTLNGISYIAFRYPFEYEALIWIQKHTADDAVILEATGKPYSFFGRVATTTGRSTVLGWGNHESLWRGQKWDAVMQRTNDIKQIYDAVDKSQVQGLLDQYQVTYVYVGQLERETYAAEGLRAFARSFTVVYQNPQVTMYSKDPAPEIR